MGAATRIWLLPRLDRWVAGPPPLEVLDRKESPPEDRYFEQPQELVGVLATMPGRHWAPITCAALSPDGKWLATGSDDRTVCVWEPVSLRTVAILGQLKDRVQFVTFAANGTELAVASGSELYRYRVSETPRGPMWLGSGLINVLPATAQIQSVCFSADGRRVALANADWTIQVWDLAAEQSIQRFTIAIDRKTKEDQDAKELLRTVALSPDGQTLGVCAGANGEILTLYDLSGNGYQVKRKLKAVGSNFAAQFSPDLKVVAAVDEDSRLKLWDAVQDKLRADLELSGPLMAFAADGKALATATIGGTVRLWDLTAEGASLRNTLMLKHGAGLEWITCSPDLKTLISGGGGIVRLWDLSGPQAHFRGTLQTKQKSVLALAFAPDGKTLAAGGWFPRAGAGEPGEEGGVQLWDLSGQQPRARVRFGGHKKEVTALAFAPNGRLLASASDDPAVRIWDLSGQVKERTNLQGCTGPLAFSPNSKQLATSIAGTIQLWTAGGDEVGRWSKYSDPKHPAHRVTALAFAPDNSVLASGTRGRTVDLWTLGGPLPGERVTLDGIQIGLGLSYTPDGKSLVTMGNDWTVLTYDLTVPTPKLKSGPVAIANGGGADPIFAIAPNGRLIGQLVASNLVIWNAATGEKQYEWRLPGEVRAIAFAPDSRHLATANNNGTVYIFRLPRPAVAPKRGRDTAPDEPP
jgi:WD40 repeat protein